MTDVEIVVASTQLRALMWPLDQYASQARELVDEHPELKPEIVAANAHVIEAMEAVKRATDFLKAKWEVESGR